MSDGKIKITECAIYECYNHRKDNSKYCIFHQPLCGDHLVTIGECGCKL